jgi:hypothetical protein
VAENEMHIVPLLAGDECDAMRLCQEAIERGLFAQVIRPPTVPAGTSRLRLAAMASHTASDMRMAASVLGEAARRLGLDPANMGEPVRELDAPEPGYEIEEADLRPTGAQSLPGVPFDIEREGSIAA